ncbi:MAG: hypothetical protein A2W26_10245 [Acidobacteria bacterium RBG_16_64_8]|nr:MAG: hypothetical protein A2W26_10245 [Acidobacteria bacterium RBG_16_64_8]
MTFPRLEIDAKGSPLLAAIGRNELTDFQNALGYKWEDSSWTEIWRLEEKTNLLRPVLSPPGTYHLLWNSLTNKPDDPPYASYLAMAEVEQGVLGAPDTVARVHMERSTYSGAVTDQRRWAAMGDVVFEGAQALGKLRLFYSESLRAWQEVETAGSGDRGVAIGALDDTTALVAWAGLDEGLWWGELRGSAWFPGSYRLAGELSTAPRLRWKPNGGFWLAWATASPHIELSHYDGATWALPETLRCAYSDVVLPDLHFTNLLDLSRDGVQRPAIIWGAFDGRTGTEAVCVCVPNDSGWTTAEELPDAVDAVGIAIARDLNEDVWVAWWPRALTGVHWKHTYTRAVPSPPVLESDAGKPGVSWTLSEPAPETWWAVLRATAGGPFEPVARVRAGPSVEMAWTDSTAPAGNALRYRIRRESVDLRYRWETPESVDAIWIPKTGALRLKLRGRNPVVGRTEFLLLGARPGRLEVEVYDLRGRLVSQVTITASGAGQDTVSLEPGGNLPPLSGVYFVRAVEAGGGASETIKIVLFR